MKTIVIGGTGFIGRNLCRRLLDLEHAVTAVGTRSDSGLTHSRYRYIQADTTREGFWQEAVGDAELIFNLAGKSISQRWTRSHTRRMVDSRILTTRNLVNSLPRPSQCTLVNASAVGYYGDGNENLLTEKDPPGDDLLARLARDWEAEAGKAGARGARVVIARFGVVLGKGGGVLDAMLPAFRSFMGGHLGTGRQWISWIHMDDLMEALVCVSRYKDMTGPVNMCAPHPVRNADFSRALGKVLGRPHHMAVPATMLKLAVGDLASALLTGQRVLPRRLLESGFEFRYPQVEDALAQILG